MTCTDCGVECDEAVLVCARCGAPVAGQVPAGADLPEGASSDPIAPPAGDGPHLPADWRPEPSARRNALVLACLGVVLLVAVTVLAWSATTVVARLRSPTSSSSYASSAPTTSPSASSSSTSSSRQVAYPQLQPGDCLVGSDLPLSGYGTWPYYFTAVPCIQRHIAEVFFADSLWPQALAFPGDDTVYSQAANRCADGFSAYVAGSVHNTADFSFETIAPDSSSWPDGDRLVVCVAYQVTDDSYPGPAPVNYSIKGNKA